MCLAVVAYRVNKNFPIIFASNRDEFYDRPTARAGFWGDGMSILSGRDLRGGGTWLGVNLMGKWGLVTNYRMSGESSEGKSSRGLLVSEFLKDDASTAAYIDTLIHAPEEYAGFNLLLFDGTTLGYYSNRSSQYGMLGPGVFGLSNAHLDTPWPKVVRAKRKFSELVRVEEEVDELQYLAVLQDEETAPDEELPDTGMGLEWERALSAPMIKTPEYGTRASTILRISARGEVYFSEYSYDGGNLDGYSRHRYKIKRTPG